MPKFKIKSLALNQRATRLRILQISYELHFSHLGSCLTAVDLIDAIYKIKKKKEKFVLSNGHAGIALYVILEKNGLIKNPGTLKKLHVHPDRNPNIGINVSTGSLGQGISIALGMAFANRKENVYCMISDGECAEGSVWEAIRIAADKKLNNLKIILNANGWGAYDSIDLRDLLKRLRVFGCKIIKVNGHDINAISNALKISSHNKPIIIFAKTNVEQLPFLVGQYAHYYIMKDKDYMQARKLLT
jgi:transketolase